MSSGRYKPNLYHSKLIGKLDCRLDLNTDFVYGPFLKWLGTKKNWYRQCVSSKRQDMFLWRKFEEQFPKICLELLLFCGSP